ncbi:MAG: pirin family protein [Betaproteobacteria bacterium]|nr:pirin family protein [Betaproteobacteria bacterium]MDH4324477.1 pirin family protein [Betaproteobacteria bacterium]MDH5210368.1 pirin family protein [Betaproteobacteria bacterium]
MTSRTLQKVIPSIPASDGAGVKLRRSLGASQLARHDPFLMLDEFYSDDPNDYLAGFPSHPHRGFETVTYMLDGHMQHKDSGGNTGDLGPGDVQWMTAARGLIHSEMPQQTEGRMRGFQLWLNLPAKEKMRPPAYSDIPAAQIPVVPVERGSVKVIAGRFGDTNGAMRGGTTDAHYWDVHLEPGASFEAALPADHNAFLYAYEGEVRVGNEALPHRAAGLLSAGDKVALVAGDKGARVLVLAGKPIGEPVVQYGPFVMNTREEIEQAIADYQAGALSREQVRRIRVA